MLRIVVQEGGMEPDVTHEIDHESSDMAASAMQAIRHVSSALKQELDRSDRAVRCAITISFSETIGENETSELLRIAEPGHNDKG